MNSATTDSRTQSWMGPTPSWIGRLRHHYQKLAQDGAALPAFSLTLPDGRHCVFGQREPEFRIHISNPDGLSAVATLDETRFCEAYMAGYIDIEGDFPAIFKLRSLLSDHHPLQAFWFKTLHHRIFGQARSDRQWIAEHYDEDADFFELFLDARRCYSHGLFVDDEESLEVAIERKLDGALTAVEAKSGHRVLDIGAGWGAMVGFGGAQGVRVTSLTLSEPSESFVKAMIAAEGLPCEVVFKHFLEYRTEQPFDAIVNLGVSEHLPDYAATLAQYQRLLKPGGRVYLDCCAARRKFPFSSFIYRYIFPGNASPLCLHEYLEEVAKTPFEVIALHQDRRSYQLTCWHWARRLERHRTEIIQRWGKSLYRRFQIYLWGCVDVFSRGHCEAYRLILQLPDR